MSRLPTRDFEPEQTETDIFLHQKSRQVASAAAAAAQRPVLSRPVHLPRQDSYLPPERLISPATQQRPGASLRWYYVAKIRNGIVLMDKTVFGCQAGFPQMTGFRV
jgi:hypothetical protein